jgi:integrase
MGFRGVTVARIPLQYVHRFRDRHGKLRHYFRRPGFKRVPLPGLPGSGPFMMAYEAALADAPRIEVGADRAKPGTIATAIAGYFFSVGFASLAANTRRGRSNILERFRGEHGDKRIATLQGAHIERMIAAKPTPATALHFLIAIRELMRFAVRTGLRADDPTSGIKRPRLKSAGFYTWGEEDIARFEAVHRIGTRARLAMSLGLYTGQRRCEILLLGRQHVRDGLVHLRQSKTGKTLAIPVHPELQVVLDAVPLDQLTFITTIHGKSFDPMAFTTWFKGECQKAGLPKGATFHGLRKAAARRLAEAGCSASIIQAITGHASLKEVSRYTAAADQLRLAKLGIQSIGRTKKWQT